MLIVSLMDLVLVSLSKLTQVGLRRFLFRNPVKR